MAKRKKEKFVTVTREYLELLWRQLDELRAKLSANSVES